MAEITGQFEIHYTVAAGAATDRLQAVAERLGLKWLLIELDRGEHRAQPMLTAEAEGSLAAVLEAARRQADQTAAAGLPVVRLKIEAAPQAAGVPRTAREARDEPPDRYFEHHLKLLLPAGCDLGALAELVEGHAAHLSRNARRRRIDGRQERFVTQRCHRVGRDEARTALQELETALLGAAHEILELEQEYVVYDSNLALDAGWLPVPARDFLLPLTTYSWGEGRGEGPRRD